MRTRHQGTSITIVTTAAAAVGAIAAIGAAQEAPGQRQLPDLPRPALVVADRHASTGGLEFSDMASATLAREADDWVIQVEMSRPLAAGMFTAFEMEWDCDGQRSTWELETRAAVGSRFRPNSYEPARGGRRPMDLVRASWGSPFDETRANPLERPRVGPTNWAALAVPSVGGTRLRFRVPGDLPENRGLRTSTSPPAFRLRAKTTCSEHPLTFDYAISDPGRDIKVDGAVEDWTGGAFVKDGSGELHPAVTHLDLTSVWCEHGADCVFVRADFAAPGFGHVTENDGDVFVHDVLVVCLEPVGVAYMDPAVVGIPATSPAGHVDVAADADSAILNAGLGRVFAADRTANSARYACGTGTVEVRIPRKPEQTRFRVAVWTDAERRDDLDGSWLALPR